MICSVWPPPIDRPAMARVVAIGDACGTSASIIGIRSSISTSSNAFGIAVAPVGPGTGVAPAWWRSRSP